MKSYMDYINGLSANEVYKGLLGAGLFSEKLPPVFTSEAFYDYCIANNPTFADKGRQYVYYENMRNINIPRPLGIPVPMVYQKLCKFISDNWGTIQSYFAVVTGGQTHKVSRIHIRKMHDTDTIFQMNYDNWRDDGSPENAMLYGKNYLVRADISKCFPSIYTHSLSWALAGKATAKANKTNKSLWYNQIDHLTQINKDMETHGLIIGPHVSNVLSEIILCAVDKEMTDKGWKYTRNIDDYMCLVGSEKEAEGFLIDLQDELRKFDLSLNHKKTSINKLPTAMTEQWTRKINTISLLTSYGQVNYKNCQTYLDFAIEIADKEKGNSSVLNYAIKTLSGMPLTDNAKQYEKEIVFHLCVIYPYLVQLLDNYVFSQCNVTTDEISMLSQTLFDDGINNKHYEQASYALYFATKYDFEIDVTPQHLIDTEDCILLTLGFLYYEKKVDLTSIKELKKYARTLTSVPEDFERMWVFAYEVLPFSYLKDEWKTLKRANVSFLRRV